MRYEDLVSAHTRPSNPRPAQRSAIDTDSNRPELADGSNAGFLRNVSNRRQRRIMRTSRRGFLAGTLTTVSAGVAASMARVGPARAAAIPATVATGSGHRVWDACPSINAGDECIPGCFPNNHICWDNSCCDADGFFRNDSNYIIRPGLCNADLGVSGWIWAYNGVCGTCSTSVQLRCSDGLAFDPATQTWSPMICRKEINCDGVPVANANNFAYTGAIGAVVDRGNGLIEVNGWISRQNDLQTTYRITIDGFEQLTGLANLPYSTGYPQFVNNHGFFASITNVPAGSHNVCVHGTTGNNIEVACLEVFTGTGTAPETSVKSNTTIPGVVPLSGVLESLTVAQVGNTATATGWATNQQGAGPVNIVVSINGYDYISTTTAGARPDVSNFNPQYSNARGYAVSFELSTTDKVDVCIWAEDPATGYRIQLGCQELIGNQFQ